ncbi:MAG: polysulfide reductase NrfD [Novosphingobium sp.]|nr:polysulfide reductase NrfD [Novosphingobium sp.]
MADSQDLRREYRAVERETVELPLAFPATRGWWLCFSGALGLLALWFVSVSVVFARGVGVWGNSIPVNWGMPIINYVWFLGIGHAGTLISALLLIADRNWRNSLNRFAEAMTLCAVVCAGLYPIIHLGRPWFFYWMAPYFNSMHVWPQFKSPLSWDFFAVLTYLLVSLLFWYLGILPDLASARDRATSRGYQVFFGLVSLGWRGQASHWARWRQVYAITAAIAVPLVVSVHSEISLLFAAGPIPGWNSTVFPPYFVLGAAFSGFAVVAMIAIGMRAALPLKALVTPWHLDMLGLALLATGLMTAYGYFSEVFDALYAGGEELATLGDRLHGQYAWSYWGAVILNFVPLQLLWSRAMRRNPWVLFAISLSVAIGMWMERFMLVVTSLYRDWLVSSYGHYTPSFWDWALYAGMGGVFLVPFLLFVRFLPVISAAETKEEEHDEAAEHG